MKFLVTGGAGFIGSNLVVKLIDIGHEVVVIDDLSSGNIKNLQLVIDRIKFVEGSILDLNLLKKEFIGMDYVLHMAAMPSVPKSVEKPLETNAANIDGTLNVLIAARDSGVKRVVYAASSSRYGNSTTDIKSESLPTKPLSPYALQKFTGEEYCRIFYKIYGLETVATIFFNVFGPNQNPDSPYSAVIPKFIKLMLKGERPVIYGDGQTSRDFTYVDNNVSAVIAAATAKEAVGQSINIALGESISLIELVKKINKILGTNIEPQFEDFRTGDVKHSLADISLAKKVLDYQVDVDFNSGLEKTINFLRSN
ncbi:SDR family oxidoreductase [Candidatus Falkowbacteria bacterium]|uniref:LPS biosynthesis protein WbpP n=1 Tax=Candidatus Buchananbacteria bacterium CG10_big_fil_rev_8_21_14_0_10_33_19 TaxID=1974525 RepID=A0A2H0W388_9BACT|nr:SDR family oxidoreductase [Candidatus Falkowbacteria bacterium]PIS05818.1 MAG: LPS biosynthesis protein WbpP [Candidatus Buchananbacteria bacterium CG10_big_fil_rev_8_21_14_0_10_33_19]